MAPSLSRGVLQPGTPGPVLPGSASAHLVSPVRLLCTCPPRSNQPFSSRISSQTPGKGYSVGTRLPWAPNSSLPQGLARILSQLVDTITLASDSSLFFQLLDYLLLETLPTSKSHWRECLSAWPLKLGKKAQRPEPAFTTLVPKAENTHFKNSMPTEMSCFSIKLFHKQQDH